MLKKKFYLSNAVIVCTLILTLLLYWQGLSGPFMLDDNANIGESQIENSDWNSIIYTVTHNSSGLLGRSVSIISFMLTDWQFGPNPWGYKFHNVLLHLANGLLIYRLFYLLLPLLEPKIRSTSIALTAAITTAFWLVHPLLVSTVLYAVQRMVELAVFFSLLALLSYFHARTRNTPDLKFVIYGWLFFPLTLLLAILSKEIGVLVPVYILIFEFLVFKATPHALFGKRHQNLWLLCFIFIPLMVAALYLITHFSDLTNSFSTRNFTLYERLLTQLHVVAYYIRLILIPRIGDMSLFQDDFFITQNLDISTLLLLGILLLMVFAIWYLRHRAPVAAFGIAWFFGSHLLESTFMPLELVFEHRNYLGALGLLLPAVYYVMQIQNSGLKVLRWLLAVFFIVFAGETYSRAQEWSNLGVFLTVAVNDHPKSVRARTEYANYLYEQGRKDEAIDQLKITMDLDSRDAGSVMHQLILLCLDGKRHVGLLADAKMRLKTWPLSAYGLNSISNLIYFVRDGICTQLEQKDIESLVAAAMEQPGNLRTVDAHANLLGFMGVFKFIDGKYQDGVDLLMRGYEISGNVLGLTRLVGFQIEFEQYDDAAKTIAIMEQQNRKKFGIETYQIRQMEKLLADARSNSILPESQPQDVESEKLIIP